eukprot:14370596-Ditylum_brightwellii.AAC.1
MEAIAQIIKGQDIQDGDAAYSLVKSLLKGGALQVFKNEEENQDVKDNLTFTICLAAVIEHVFPKKAYKTQKRVTATKISHEEFVDVLENRIQYQWILEFKRK